MPYCVASAGLSCVHRIKEAAKRLLQSISEVWWDESGGRAQSQRLKSRMHYLVPHTTGITDLILVLDATNVATVRHCESSNLCRVPTKVKICSRRDEMK